MKEDADLKLAGCGFRRFDRLAGRQATLVVSEKSAGARDSEGRLNTNFDSAQKRSLALRANDNVSADRLAFRERLLEVVREVGGEAELERRAGLPAATITHYTRARPSEPSRAYLVKVALAAGVSIAWLAAGIGPKKVSE